LTVFEPGAVVVALYPFSDLPMAKPRPALVLSTAEFSKATGQVLLAMITTAARSSWPDDVPVTNLQAAGLSRACVVRTKFVTVTRRLIRDRIGALSSVDRAAASAACRGAIGL
jgi:mRNA interferase MazF